MGMSKATLVGVVKAVPTTLVHVMPRIVYFPGSSYPWQVIENEFQRKRGFPGVMGAIDGSLIEIERPSDYEGFFVEKAIQF